MKRIAVTGPESTGKTILSKRLAEHYGCLWVQEYAREYLEELSREYDFGDVTNIAKGQWSLINNAFNSGSSFIVDTELIVTQIWQMVRFGCCDHWIEEHIDKQPFDLYFLCAPDIPWEYDPLREHPEMREILFEKYYHELNERGLPFVVIKGMGEERFRMALNEITQRADLY